MSDTDAVRRQVNLTFALLGSNGARSSKWVGRNVDGYEGRTPDALALLLKRDVAELRSLWVPIHFEHGEVWLNKEQYELEPVELTEAEASAMGLAADLAHGANLGAFARSGWTKLAASGARRSFDAPAIASISNDITRLDPRVLQHLLYGVRNQLRLSFDFLPAQGEPVQRRHVDPWGVVPLNNRTYLVGWDVDRGAERAFRVHKISNVGRRQVGDFHSPTVGVQEVVEKLLRGEVASARVTLEPGAGDELASRGVREGDDVVLDGVERHWLVRTIASLAGRVTAVEPEDVRRDVIALLEHVEHAGHAERAAQAGEA